MRAHAVVALLLLVTVSGCIGGQERSQWAYTSTQLDTTYAEGRTGRGVTVGILDTGINLGHPSLDHLGDDDRANGEVIAFKDYLVGDEGVEKARDPDGHGSHVTGILAGRGSGTGSKILYNGVDLLGGAPDVRLVIVRVCDDDHCDGQGIVDGVRWATAQNVDILSLSLGGEAARGVLSDLMQDRLESAINSAIDQGIVVVASAGNSGPDNEQVNSPADIPRVIAVGAIDKDLKVWSGSSRGDNPPCRLGGVLGSPATGRCDPHKKPEVVAPGVEVLSAWTGDSYARATGTSQATPFVTSAVAAMLQGAPELRDAQGVRGVKEALMDTAKPLRGQQTPHDDGAGYGLLQAADAVARYR